MTTNAPITQPEQDRFGTTGQMAAHVARAVMANDLSEGYVLGVQGGWGSGKSSLVELTLGELKDKVIAIRFEPWLIGDRDDLLGQLFAEMGRAVSDMASLDQKLKDEASSLLDQFSKLAGGVKRVAKLASYFGVPWADVAADAAGKAQEVTGETREEPSLFEKKRALTKILAQLEKPIVIFVDDLDRLDPGEAVEVLRLVRAVADFPNIVYLIAYDEDVLAHNLEEALKIEDGQRYLDKIVQASVRIPQPSGYDLMSWLMEELAKLFPNLDTDTQNRLRQVAFSWVEEWTQTPRDVVRLVAAMKLYAVPVADKIDAADMLFLQAARLKQPALYAWIEDYMQPIILRATMPVVTKVAKDVKREALTRATTNIDDRTSLFHWLSTILPGIHERNDDEELLVWDEFVSFYDIERVNRRGVGSPYHAAYYFSLAHPDWMLSHWKYETFRDKLRIGVDAALDNISELDASPAAMTGTLAHLLFQRLMVDRETFDQQEAENLLWVCADCFDRMVPQWNAPPRWALGEYWGLFETIRRIPEYPVFIMDFAEKAKSLRWLVQLLADSSLANSLKDRNDIAPLVGGEVFIAFAEAILPRVKALDSGELMALPDVLRMLDLLETLESLKNMQELVERITTTDTGLLWFLREIARKKPKGFDGVNPADLERYFGEQNDILQRLDRMPHHDQRVRNVREAIETGHAGKLQTKRDQEGQQ